MNASRDEILLHEPTQNRTRTTEQTQNPPDTEPRGLTSLRCVFWLSEPCSPAGPELTCAGEWTRSDPTKPGQTRLNPVRAGPAGTPGRTCERVLVDGLDSLQLVPLLLLVVRHLGGSAAVLEEAATITAASNTSAHARTTQRRVTATRWTGGSLQDIINCKLYFYLSVIVLGGL